MNSGRKSVDLSTVKRLEGFNSSRRNPLSSRLSQIVHHHHLGKKAKSPRRMWNVGIAMVRAVIRMKRSRTLPHLSQEEEKEIMTKFYSVVCLNSVATITEFVASMGIHIAEEDRNYLLGEIKFHDGQALTVYKILRLLKLLKRKHFSTSSSSDTTEAFSALAVNGSIPMDTFKETMKRFDLRVRFHDKHGGVGGGEDEDEQQQETPNGTKNHFGGANSKKKDAIDLERFRRMMQDDDVDNATKNDNERSKKRFSRLSIGSQLHQSTAKESSSSALQGGGTAHSPDHSGTPSSTPKPLDAIFTQIKSRLEWDSNPIFKKGGQAASGSGKAVLVAMEKSPVRHEVFPVKMNRKKWEFSEVLQRIDEIEKRPDVRRQYVSRNAKYCSNDHRPPYALLTPFNDLSKKSTRSELIPPVDKRLLRSPPRGLPHDVAVAGHQRSISAPLFDEKYPILSHRRERLMDSLPHRNFEENGAVPWGLSEEQRAAILQSKRPMSWQRVEDNMMLRQMAAATLSCMNSIGGSERRY